MDVIFSFPCACVNRIFRETVSDTIRLFLADMPTHLFLVNIDRSISYSIRDVSSSIDIFLKKSHTKHVTETNGYIIWLTCTKPRKKNRISYSLKLFILVLFLIVEHWEKHHSSTRPISIDNNTIQIGIVEFRLSKRIQIRCKQP